MVFLIERLSLTELKSFLQKQADEFFFDLRDKNRLTTLAEKWSTLALFSTCRDERMDLVGMIAFYANRCEGKVSYIPHVYVSSEYRGFKVFSSMMRLVEDYVKRKGYIYLRLEVKKDNIIAQRAYLHYGFSFIEDASESSFFMQYYLA
jgi:ribosomal protein S18 acetylase RimI-like enzyme